MTSSLLALTHEPALLGPPSKGLFEAVSWQQEGEPLRFLAAGVTVRQPNFVDTLQVGVWGEAWNVAAVDVTTDKIIKRGDLTDLDFLPFTLYAYDQDPCPHRLMDEARSAVQSRATALLARHEQTQAELKLAATLTANTPTPGTAANLGEAVSLIEIGLADAGLDSSDGFVFANVEDATALLSAQFIEKRGGQFFTALDYRVIFTTELVAAGSLRATPQLYGWRGSITTRDHIEHTANDYIAIAERSMVIGYEAVVVAADVTGP